MALPLFALFFPLTKTGLIELYFSFPHQAVADRPNLLQSKGDLPGPRGLSSPPARDARTTSGPPRFPPPSLLRVVVGHGCFTTFLFQVSGPRRRFLLSGRTYLDLWAVPSSSSSLRRPVHRLLHFPARSQVSDRSLISAFPRSTHDGLYFFFASR